MSCCNGGGTEVDKDERDKARALNKQLDEMNAEESAVIKLLLLGAGESGKSTIFKQMKIINAEGYTLEERKSYVGIIHSNTIQSMNHLLQAQEKCAVQIKGVDDADDKQCQDDIEMVNKMAPMGAASDIKLTKESAAAIERLWKNDKVQEIFARRSEFQLNDSAEFYFKKVAKLSEDDYIPDEQDVLRSRVRTTGIVQSDFEIKDVKFTMYDVGGQRNERRKWIHCFDNVHAVIFVAAMSEYDQVLYEDEKQNRMMEALDLFDQICNNKCFEATAMILFLNKRDLFQIKLEEKKKDMALCFPDGDPRFEKGYDEWLGSGVSDWTIAAKFEYQAAADYLMWLFKTKNRNSEKTVYVHCTCATDTSNVQFVLDSVVSIVLEGNMKSSGLG